MNEEALNMSLRKFLKIVGVTSQQEIEKAVRAAAAGGKLKGKKSVQAQMVLTIGVPQPRMASEPGSCTGAAAQLQRWTGRTKCSADLMVTGASRHNAVPGALVPAWRSSHCAPSTNPIGSTSPISAG